MNTTELRSTLDQIIIDPSLSETVSLVDLEVELEQMIDDGILDSMEAVLSVRLDAAADAVADYLYPDGLMTPNGL